RLSVTSTWSSSGRRSGSLRGEPMMNFPGAHQQSGIPLTLRVSPAFAPIKESAPRAASERKPPAIAEPNTIAHNGTDTNVENLEWQPAALTPVIVSNRRAPGNPGKSEGGQYWNYNGQTF